METSQERLDGGVALLRINRPEARNALNGAVREQLAAHFSALAADDEVRCAVIAGSASVFAAGADVKAMAEAGAAEMMRRATERFWVPVREFPKPLIAAVNGFALGGGCELALACHLRVASENAKFGLPEVKLGIIPGYGGTLRLPRIVGKGRALELMLTAEMVDAQEAYRIGLANKVVPLAELMDAARAMMKGILKNGPVALGLAIECATRGMEMSVDDGLALESNLFGLLASTTDMREGMTAFLEKRRAEFTGR